MSEQLPYFLDSDESSKNAYTELFQKTNEILRNSFTKNSAYTGLEPQELSDKIKNIEILPQNGKGTEKVFDEITKNVIPNFLRTSSNEYLAHLHGPSLLESLVAENILNVFNQSMDSWDQSPVATEIELATIKMLTKLFGYSENADGCFTSGGSQSNLTGILMARDWFCKKIGHDVKKHGLPQNYAKFRLYTSEISHFSMDKACHLLGLGYDAAVKVPVTAQKKIDIQTLSDYIKKDINSGNIPFCIVATIGTTDFGSIDDICALKKIADKFGLYLHADAAYGSGLIMSQKYRERAGDFSLCDSITVDFHKMFLQPISCSAILVRDSELFSPLELHADYLNREEDEEDGYTNLVGKSIQTTRRFDAFKVWVSFQTRGKNGFEKIINTCIENADYTYTKLKENKNFEVLLKPELSAVVFRAIPKNNLKSKEIDELNKKVRRQLLHKEGIVIGQTVNEGKTFLKFTLLNPNLTTKKIDSILDTILNLACQIA